MTGDDYDNRERDDEIPNDRFVRDALDGLIARALEQENPVAWLHQCVQSALDRLDVVDRPASLKEEAKRLLFGLEQRLIRAIREGRSDVIVAALSSAWLTGVSFF
jgi:hypothetical protein